MILYIIIMDEELTCNLCMKSFISHYALSFHMDVIHSLLASLALRGKVGRFGASRKRKNGGIFDSDLGFLRNRSKSG